MYNHVLVLRVKGCQYFGNFMCGSTHHKSQGLGLTAANEVHRRIVYILENIYVFL